MFVFWAAPSPAPPRKAAAVDTGTTTQIYTRDALATLVVGKTKDEVVKLLGQPESTNERAGSWRYLEVTIDPMTGKTDHSTTLLFDAHGRVERVSFNSAD
jgi:outer membrane protein assembly factor BamE (lipoprotein component of BamABCDE complex)